MRRGKSKPRTARGANSHPCCTGAERAAQHAKKLFSQGVPQKWWKVQQERLQTSKQQIKEEFQDWVSNSGLSRSRDKKVFRAMEFYWLTKSLVSLPVENKGHQEPETLDRLRKLEAKFIVLCRVVFGLSFKVSDWEPGKEDETVEVTGTPDLQSTSSNPIIIEDEPGQEVTSKAKAPATYSYLGLSEPTPS